MIRRLFFFLLSDTKAATLVKPTQMTLLTLDFVNVIHKCTDTSSTYGTLVLVITKVDIYDAFCTHSNIYFF